MRAALHHAGKVLALEGIHDRLLCILKWTAKEVAFAERWCSIGIREEMTQHYSHIGLDEKRAAVAKLLELVPLTAACCRNLCPDLCPGN